MTDRAELQLREFLLDLGTHRTPDAVEERLPALVEARFAAEEAVLSLATQERHLEAIRLHVLERGNGHAPWLTGLFRRPSRPRNWAFAALIGAGVFIAVLFLSVPSLRQKAIDALNWGPKREAPRNEFVPKPRERVVKDDQIPAPDEKTPDRTTNEAPPRLKPRHKKEQGLLAQRVEVGRFTSVMGEPKVTNLGDKAGRHALPKMSVTTAMRIETGDADKAEIRFADGSTIALGFNTTIVVPAIPGGSRSGLVTAKEISVSAGSISASIAHSEERGRFAVRTPVATAEVLGTEFSLALKRQTQATGNAKLSAILQVREGRVAFYNELGRVVAGTSTQSTATEDSAPTEPKRLITLKVSRMGSGDFLVDTSRQLGGSEAADRFVYPLGSAGLKFVTSPLGEVRVVDSLLGLPANGAGVRVGDILVALNGAPVRSADSVRQEINQRPRQKFSLTVNRRGETLTFSFETVQAGSVKTWIPPRLAERLYAATWPAIAGDSERSLQMLRVLASEVENAAVHNNLGVVFETRDQMGPAIRHYQTAVRLDPSCPKFHYNLSLALEKIGNFERSAEEASKAAESDPKFRRALYQWSSALYLLNRHEEALAVLDSARFPVDRDRSYWTMKATMLHASRRLDEAAQAATKAVDIDPDSSVAHCHLGLILQDEGRLKEAEESYRRAVELNPDDAIAIVLLGSTLDGLGRVNDAELCYRDAIRVDPKMALAYNGLGRLLTLSGRFQEAEERFRRAIALAPDFAIAHNNLGSLLGRQGQLGEAEAMYRKAIKLDPNYAGPCGNLGSLLQNTGRLQEAESMYRQALMLDPRRGDISNKLGVVLVDLRRAKEAEEAFRRAISLDPQNMSAHFNLGRLQQAAGRAQEAEATYHRAIELAPKSALPYYSLGNFLRDQGRVQEAETMLRRAIELDPKFGEAYTNLGHILRGLRRAQEAETMFRKAIEVAPKLANAYANLGALLQDAGRVQEADAMFRKAIELDPGSENSYYNRAQILEQQGRFDEAEETYRAWVKAAPKSARALGWLAWFLVDHDRKLAEALGFSKRQIAVTPDDPSALDTLGWIYYKLKDFENAEVSFKRSLALYTPAPDVADVWVHLGLTYEGLNKREQAVEAYRQALKLQPGQKDATEALKRLGG